MRTRSFRRVAQVTAGLSLVGAVVGGILGGILIVLLAARAGDGRGLGELLATGALFGSAMGIVLAPLAAWTLMTRVPIWRAVVETAAGTFLGAAAGLVFQPMHDVAWLSPVWLGIAGFFLAAVRLRLRAAHPAGTSQSAVRRPAKEP